MAQKGKLSKAEIFYIEQHGHLDPEQIAEELDRSVSSVLKYYTPKPEIVKKAKEDTPFMRNLGRHKRNGKVVATILTKGASDVADSSRKSVKVSDLSYIHNPRGNDE